ncbi:MAG: hypothetical protein HON76_03735 [Candidatus Scalindua sp.]|nr:hypothetical protein [Candidatus Scalindua sp.]
MKLLILVILPVVLFVLSIYLTSRKGPYYLGLNLDPEYVYLLSSLELLQYSLNPLNFSSPSHTDHPGTTLQILGALVMHIKYSLTGIFNTVHDLTYEVITNAEEYLRVINLALNVLIAALLFVAGYITYRFQKSLTLSVCMQLVPFLFKPLILSITRISPEPMMILAIIGIAIVLIPVFSQKEFDEFTPKRGAVFGAIIGFGIVTKVTFFPLVLLLLIPKGWREKLYGFAGFLVSIAILTIPIWKKFGVIWNWLLNIATHKGRYGGGEAGVPNLEILWKSQKMLFFQEPYFFVFTGLMVLFLIYLYIKRKSLNGVLPSKKIIKIVSIYTAILIVQIVITVKHPLTRYMLPSMTMIGVIIFTLVSILKAYWPDDKNNKVIKYIVIGVLLIFITFSVKSVIDSINATKKHQRHYADVKKLQKFLKSSYPDSTVIYYYRSSSPTYALAFGNGIVHKRFSDILHRLYPEAYFYHKWGQFFYNFGSGNSYDKYDYKSCYDRLKAGLDNGKSIFLQGVPVGGNFTVDYTPKYMIETEKLMVNTREAIYRIRSFKKIDRNN